MFNNILTFIPLILTYYMFNYRFFRQKGAYGKIRMRQLKTK